MITAHAYFSPKLDLTKQNGVFTIGAFKKGEVVALWNGAFTTRLQFAEMPEKNRLYSVQIEEDIFLVPDARGTIDAPDYIMHSCEPNIGISGQLTLLALRDIGIGEKISVDFATLNSSEYLEMDCQCGAPNCRKRITKDDWQIPALQEKYKGYFIPYLQRRIDALKK